VARKKPGRKKEPPPKRRIAWPRWTGFRGKTVWDWMQLLIVPIALSLITLAFTWQQDTRQQKIEDRRAQVERAVEEQRAQAEREIQEERAEHAPWLPSGRSGALCARV
jgi:hypothetical protein